MKTNLLLLVATLTIITACSTFQKNDDIEGNTDYQLVVSPSEELARRSGTSLKELHIGFGVWVRECGKCHDHVFPEEIPSSDWHAVTPKMAWNANITDTEQKALLKYLLAAKDESDPLGKQLESVQKATE